MPAVKLKLVEEQQSVPGSKSPAKKKVAAPKVKKRDACAMDLMCAVPISCHVGDSLNEAARQMWDHDLGVVVVVDDAKRPLGMITDRDICVAAYTQGRPLYECGVASAMSKTLVSCEIDTPVSEVRALMAEAKVRRMPVLDKQGALVGVIGFSDLMAEAHAALPKDRKRGSTGPQVAQMVQAVLGG